MTHEAGRHAPPLQRDQGRAAPSAVAAAPRARASCPGLGTVLVGDDPGSHWYVGAKHKDCAEIGIESIRRRPAGDRDPGRGRGGDRRAERRPGLHRLPRAAADRASTSSALLSRVDPDKDVDGLHPINLGKLVLGEPGSLPCTPVGCIELLRRHGVEIAGAEVVVVGRGLTVGRPLGLLLTRRSENATVTLCHTGTRDLAAHTRNADIVVAAAGVPGIITGDMVKPGAAVLDVGVSPGRRQDRRRRAPTTSGTSPAGSRPTPAASAR